MPFFKIALRDVNVLCILIKKWSYQNKYINVTGAQCIGNLKLYWNTLVCIQNQGNPKNSLHSRSMPIIHPLIIAFKIRIDNTNTYILLLLCLSNEIIHTNVTAANIIPHFPYLQIIIIFSYLFFWVRIMLCESFITNCIWNITSFHFSKSFSCSSYCSAAEERKNNFICLFVELFCFNNTFY